MSTAFTVWCTGLPSSGKTALAEELAHQLATRGLPAELINSGKMRRTPLGAGLGFSKEDRDTNVHRHGFAANLLVRNGVIAVVSAVSPYGDARDAVRAELKDFIEVYVSTPRAACVDRDKSGNWVKALNGDIRSFTGVDDPYEEPENPEIEMDLSQISIEAGVRRVLSFLEEHKRIPPMPDLGTGSEDDRLLDPGAH